MKPSSLLVVCTAIIVSSAGCRRKAMTSDLYQIEDRVAMLPAADAREWLGRLEKDAESWRPELDHLYPELPPQAEWPEITKALRSDDLAVDQRHRAKLRFFAAALDRNPAAMEASFRTMLLNQKADVSEYDLKKLPGYLAAFSQDQAEAQKWLTEHFPKALEPKKPYRREETPIDKLLAENKVDEAIVLLWEDAGKQEKPIDRLEPLGKLAAIGRLLGKDDLHEKAFAALSEGAYKGTPDEVWGSYQLQPYINELLIRNDWKAIRKLAKHYESGERVRGEFFPHALAATYQLDGPEAFLKQLAADGPKHGIHDKASYLRIVENEMKPAPSIGEMVVRAQHAAGKAEEARITLFHLLAIQGGKDSLYRTAVELFPDASPAYFQQLRTYNPYEERPLIWLADLALKGGNPDEARKLIDEAIALDPSDGEQGKDTRMQAYDVLSRILRAKGDNEKADFFNNVMLAIRRGEAADDFLNAGLVAEAIRRYQEALGSFQDAYCLQSRLAKTLMKAGKFDEAKVHFEKAFELMPLSFGPVESHCFGCEQIFADPRVQAIADAVFRKAIAAKPGNPRTHYLLGLLLEETGNVPEAIISYRKAIGLDPGYYNCALRLRTLLAADPTRQKEANDMLDHLRKISPYPLLGNHYKLRTDLAQAWIDAQTPPPSPLKLDPLPLPFKPGPAPKGFSVSYSYFSSPLQAVDGWSPQELLQNNGLVDWMSGL